MKCEACKERDSSSELKVKKTKGCDKYELCLNCLAALINLCLTKEQFKNLLKSGHKDTEFYLHEDFYDEEGNALQPYRT